MNHSDSVVVAEDATGAVGGTDGVIRITIFSQWCKGCGICSAFCPTQAIVADSDGRPHAAHPERCTACQQCVLRCPDMAIQVIKGRS